MIMYAYVLLNNIEGLVWFGARVLEKIRGSSSRFDHVGGGRFVFFPTVFTFEIGILYYNFLIKLC